MGDMSMDDWAPASEVEAPGDGGLEATFDSNAVVPADEYPLALCSDADDL